MSKAFTFKKTIHTGQFRSFENEHHDIKLGGKICGSISEQGNKSYQKTPPEEIGMFKVSFTVKKESFPDSPADFRWVTLKRLFKDAEEARQFVTVNAERLQKNLDIRPID